MARRLRFQPQCSTLTPSPDPVLRAHRPTRQHRVHRGNRPVRMPAFPADLPDRSAPVSAFSGTHHGPDVFVGEHDPRKISYRLVDAPRDCGLTKIKASRRIADRNTDHKPVNRIPGAVREIGPFVDEHLRIGMNTNVRSVGSLGSSAPGLSSHGTLTTHDRALVIFNVLFLNFWSVPSIFRVIRLRLCHAGPAADDYLPESVRVNIKIP